MTTASALPCGACGADLLQRPHDTRCPRRRAEADLRAVEIAPPAWRVLRLSRDPAVRRLEELLEECSRRARAWLKVRGRSFPC